MRSSSHRLRNVLKFVLGMLLATMAVEAYLRLVEVTPLWRVLPAAEASLYGPDPATGYGLRPGVEGLWLTEHRSRLRISGQGLRDNPTAYAKPPGVFRIALAGDSITEAVQVELEETFSERLEQAFVREGRHVEVLNLGMSGAVPPVQVARMGSLGLRFSPDLQVYLINVFDFLSPVLADDRQFPGYVQGADDTYRLGHGYRDSAQYRFRTSQAGEVYYWLMDNLRVARVLNSRKNHGFGLGTGGSAEVSTPPSCDAERTLRLLAAIQGGTRQGDSVFKAFLRDVSAVSRASDVAPLLLLRGLAGGCDAEEAAKVRLRAALSRLLDEAGVEMLDMDAALAAALERAGAGYETKDLYGFGSRIGQGHLNSFGHQIFAAALWDGLLARVIHGAGTRQAASLIEEARQP